MSSVCLWPPNCEYCHTVVISVGLQCPWFCWLQSEWSLMQGIIPDKQQRRCFETLIQAALDAIVKEGEVSVNCQAYSCLFEDHQWWYLENVVLYGRQSLNKDSIVHIIAWSYNIIKMVLKWRVVKESYHCIGQYCSEPFCLNSKSYICSWNMEVEWGAYFCALHSVYLFSFIWFHLNCVAVIMFANMSVFDGWCCWCSNFLNLLIMFPPNLTCILSLFSANCWLHQAGDCAAQHSSHHLGFPSSQTSEGHPARVWHAAWGNQGWTSGKFWSSDWLKSHIV